METKFEVEVLSRLAVIESKLDGYKTTQETAENANHRSIENAKDIAELQDKIKWLSRTIAAAIITGLIGLVFVFVKIGMGIN